jgi:hypothetical protein
MLVAWTGVANVSKLEPIGAASRTSSTATDAPTVAEV